MPLLDHETILRTRIPPITLPSWWRQKVSKYSNRNNNSSNDDITDTKGTTRDWRSLSPNNPPLPFVYDNDHSKTNSDFDPYIQTSERAPKRLPIPNRYRHSSYDDGQLLSTIIEESDLLTEISLSPKNSGNHHRQQRQRQQQQQQQQHGEEKLECGFATNTTIVAPPQHNHDKNNDIAIVPLPALPPNGSPHMSSVDSNLSTVHPNETMISSIEAPLPTCNPCHPSFIESSSFTSLTSSNTKAYHPATIAATTTASPSSIEISAKHEFINMLQMVYKLRQYHQSSIPTKMEISFDSQDNVHKLHIFFHDKIQSHVFQGNTQYLPPELPTCRTYDRDRVDVWILGISLYRTLVGKYPFQANNDRQLFSKMQLADFEIPSHLSIDVKDLLCRMLAPEHARMSMDFVKHHPWLKQYSALPSIKPSPSLLKPMAMTPSISPRVVQQDLRHTTRSSFFNSASHHHAPPLACKQSIVSKLKNVFVFITQGPCPPPRHPYRDLSPTKSF